MEEKEIDKILRPNRVIYIMTLIAVIVTIRNIWICNLLKLQSNKRPKRFRTVNRKLRGWRRCIC